MALVESSSSLEFTPQSLQNQLSAFNAFEIQLRTLCLNEFPCGVGQWKEDFNTKKSKLKTTQLNNKYSITLKDYGASHEKTETLEELVRSKKSPWNLDYSWSEEAKDLRETAVRSPWLIDDQFVLNHFRTLRIADKGITEVDEDFLKFRNLEELTLSANFLKTVNSRHLPRNLKVLELCANDISNLADICISPPSLIHLGLGHNKLYMIEDYITGEFWPHLLSLDLTYNNLTDLMEVIRKLQSLPKLRNLNLQGNPLALVPGYRGFTIDSIRKLDFLDEIAISADEKHHYKGLAKRKELVLDEAKFIFAVDFIRGVPIPDEIQNADDQPEFPLVTKKYFVQFMFLKDTSATQEIFQLIQDGDQLSTGRSPQVREDALRSELTARSVQTPLSGTGSAPEKNIIFDAEIRKHSIPEDNISLQSDMPLITFEGEKIADKDDDKKMQEDPEASKLTAIDSEKSEWAEEMELSWKKVVTRDNLLELRDFLKQGMQIKVVEEKILSFPVETKDEDGSPSAKSPGKKDDKKKDKGKDDGKKKKKKGEPDVELQHMPPEYKIITTFHIPMEDMLEMEYQFENVFRKNNNGEDGFVTPASVMLDSMNKKEKKKDGDSGKKGSAKKKQESPKKKDGDKKAGAGGKADKKGNLAAALPEEDEPPPPPPPLEVGVAIRLIHWETAADSLKPDLPEQS